MKLKHGLKNIAGICLGFIGINLAGAEGETISAQMCLTALGLVCLAGAAFCAVPRLTRNEE